MLISLKTFLHLENILFDDLLSLTFTRLEDIWRTGGNWSEAMMMMNMCSLILSTMFLFFFNQPSLIGKVHWSEIVCEGTIGQRCLGRTATALSSLPRTSLDGKHFKENKVEMGFIYFLLMWNYFCPNQVSSAPVNWKINVNQINWHEQHWLNQVLPKSAFNF